MPQTSDWIIELGRIIRFGSIGVLATLVYASATVVAVEVFRLSPIPASIVGQAVSAAISYLGHALYSFGVKPDHGTYLWRFLVVTVVVLGLNMGVTWLMTTWLSFSYQFSVGVITILIPATNYLCNRFWVFFPGIDQSTPAKPTKNSFRESGRT